MTPPDCSAQDRWWSRAKLILVVLAALIALAGLAAPGALLVWRSNYPTAILQESQTGSLMMADVAPSIISGGTVTHLRTTFGNVMVQGAVSGPSGTALMIERDNKTPGLQVCTVHAPMKCAGLVGVWVGDLHVTPEHGHVIDFVAHGWTTDNLVTWMAFGMVALCVVVLFLAVFLCARDDCADGNKDVDESAPEASQEL